MGKLKEIPARIVFLIVGLFVAVVGLQIYTIANTPPSPETIAKGAIRSVVVIQCKGAITAGFVLSEKGYIASVAHGVTECTSPSDDLIVRFWDKPNEALHARLVRIDTVRDGAILLVSGMPRAPALALNTHFQASGARIVAIGHPDANFWTVATGVVGADRIWPHPYQHLIQITFPCFFGFSGGPIIDEAGRVIGVVSFFRPGTELSFITPSETLEGLSRGLAL